MAGKTKYVQLRGYIEWAQVFEDNRDKESTNPKVQKMLKACDGQYKMRFYPADEEELEKAKASGLTEELYGGSQRFKNGSDLGAGVYFELKRKHKDKKTFTQKDGTEKEEDFGGPPEIVWWNDDRRNDPWNREIDGNLNNGAEAVVKFTVYGDDTGQTVRLLKIGVIENGVYEQGERL